MLRGLNHFRVLCRSSEELLDHARHICGPVPIIFKPAWKLVTTAQNRQKKTEAKKRSKTGKTLKKKKIPLAYTYTRSHQPNWTPGLESCKNPATFYVASRTPQLSLRNKIGKNGHEFTNLQKYFYFWSPEPREGERVTNTRCGGPSAELSSRNSNAAELPSTRQLEHV